MLVRQSVSLVLIIHHQYVSFFSRMKENMMTIVAIFRHLHSIFGIERERERKVSNKRFFFPISDVINLIESANWRCMVSDEYTEERRD